MTPPIASQGRSGPPLGHGLAIVVLMAALGWAGTYLRVPPDFSAMVWPAAGVALAAFVVWGPAMWPAVLAGAIASDLIVTLAMVPTLSPRPVVMAAAIAGGDVLAALTGALLIRRVVDQPITLDDERDVLKFFALGAAACLVSAVLGPLVLLAGGAISGDEVPYNVWAWWMGDATGVIVAAPALLPFIARPRRLWRRRILGVALPIAMGFAATVILFERVNQSEQKRIELQFDDFADGTASRAATLLASYLEGVHALASFYQGSGDVTADEFAVFTTPFLARHKGVYALDFAERVPGPGGDRFLIALSEPRGRDLGRGRDLASIPGLAAILVRARIDGELVATGPLALPSGGDRGILLVAPVFARTSSQAGDDRRGALRGYVIGELRVADLAASIGEGVDRRDAAIELSDVGPDGPPTVLFADPRRRETPDPLPVAIRTTAVADRSWSLEVAATTRFYDRHREWQSWLVLVGGLLFTAMLGAFLLIGTGRALRIQVLVDQRTSELAEANQRLHEEVRRREEGERSIAAHAEELERSNGEKEVLLKEIHHRVKNNLQVISSLLNLQSRQIADPIALASFKESQNRVRSMALFHEQVYRSKDLARIDLGEYIRNVATTLLQTYGVDSQRVSVVVAGDEVQAGVDVAISAGLIANELIANSIKYAFPDGRAGTIRIQLRRGEAGTVLLEVSDDGVGMPAGFELKTTRSFGLQLVATLVEQLEGELALADGNPGSRFTIRLNLPRQHTGKTPVPGVAAVAVTTGPS